MSSASPLEASTATRVGLALGGARQVEHVALAPQLDAALIADVSPTIGRLPVEGLKERVVVPGVVVDQQQPLGGAATGEGQGVRKARVAPAAVRGVLVLGVLAVVDQ